MAEDEEEPGKWKREEDGWTRSSEEPDPDASEGSRYYELPDGSVVREHMSEEEVEETAPPKEAAEPAEAEEEGGRFGGLFGGEAEAPDEPGEPAEAAEAEDEDSGSRVPIIAAVVIILVLLLIGVVAAAVMNVADPLGLRDSLQLGDSGSDGGDGGVGANGDDGGGSGNQTPEKFLWPVDWTTDTFEQTRSGNLSDGEETTEQIVVNQINVTRVTVILTWTDDDQDPTGTTTSNDTFTLSILGPQGQTNEEDSDDGRIALSFNITTPPASTTVTAETKENATKKTRSQINLIGGGTWNVTISLNAESCQMVGDEQVGDCSNDWDLAFEYEWYEAVIGDPQPIDDSDGS